MAYVCYYFCMRGQGGTPQMRYVLHFVQKINVRVRFYSRSEPARPRAPGATFHAQKSSPGGLQEGFRDAAGKPRMFPDASGGAGRPPGTSPGDSGRPSRRAPGPPGSSGRASRRDPGGRGSPGKPPGSQGTSKNHGIHEMFNVFLTEINENQCFQ